MEHNGTFLIIQTDANIPTPYNNLQQHKQTVEKIWQNLQHEILNAEHKLIGHIAKK